MHAHGHGYFQLRAYAVGARDKHRVFPFFLVESVERAEAANAAQHAGRVGAAREVANSLFDVVGDRDVHSGVSVAHGGNRSFSGACGRPKIRELYYV